MLWRFLLTRRGGRNLHSRFSVERAWGQTHKNRKSNGGLPRPGFPQNKGFQGAAAFDFRSIFSNEIKETGWKRWQKTAAGAAAQGRGRGASQRPVKDFLKSPQKSGRELVAEEVYNETYAWLKARGCEKLVTVQMVEQYAMSVSRWIQCEEIVSSTGFLAKHPTTGAAIASPYVSMSQSYMKQTNYCWMQIYQIVKENCSVEFQGNTPQDDVMERLLRARKGV